MIDTRALADTYRSYAAVVVLERAAEANRRAAGATGFQSAAQLAPSAASDYRSIARVALKSLAILLVPTIIAFSILEAIGYAIGANHHPSDR